LASTLSGRHASELHDIISNFTEEQKIDNFYDVGQGGVCHQVMPEKGCVRPEKLIVSPDSRTCTYGAFGVFATGTGPTELPESIMEILDDGGFHTSSSREWRKFVMNEKTFMFENLVQELKI